MLVNEIHGYPVIAWAQTERQSDGSICGYVLVRTKDRMPERHGRAEWCTAWYRQGDREWSTGNYFTRLDDAFEDFVKRARTYLG